MKKTCVIAGSGPSLLRTEISLIPEDIYFIACNHYYKLMNNYSRKPDAIVITDSYRLAEIGDNYSNFSGELFVGHQKYIIPPYDKIKKIVKRDFYPVTQLAKRQLNNRKIINKIEIPQVFHDLLFDKRKWSNNSTEVGLNFGSSVIFSAIQIAIEKGFTNIILIGVDANYKIENYPFETLKGMYLDDSFMKNPRLSMEPFLVSIQIFFESFGVRIVDCTSAGSLKFIEKSDLKNELGI